VDAAAENSAQSPAVCLTGQCVKSGKHIQ